MSDDYSNIVGSLDDPGQGGLFTQKRDPRIGVLDVFAAKKIESGLEALLVQTDPILLSGIEEWPQSEGFHINIRPIEGKFGEAILLCLELSSANFRDVFCSLAEDICRVLLPETDSREAIRKMHRRLYRWQEFLMRHKSDGLSPEKRTGLFGELEILRALFLKTLDSNQAVKGWRGCKKANQDFQFPGLALEVKTTRAVTPDRIHISNIQQLDEEGVNNMFLSVVWVHQNESAGTSLPVLITNIRNCLPDHARIQFDEGLMEVGYLDVHQPLYDRELYQIREVMLFSVKEGFPRMRNKSIPNGVKGVKYQISIDACKPYLVEKKSFISVLSELKGEN